MLGQIKHRFFSLQEEITASVKNLSPLGKSSDSRSCGQDPVVTKADLESGGSLLESWQESWEEIHLGHENNAKSAARCDTKITDITRKAEKQWTDVTTLQMLVSQIPKINAQIKEIMDSLGNLESLFGDVEVSLLALEDTIDARELQEKQLEQRFQLAMYQERRKAEFNELATRLQTEYDKKKSDLDRHNFLVSKEKQSYYQDKFEQDMKEYRNKSDVLLTVPMRHDPDASLETVDLNDDPEEAAGASSLEAFLAADSDLLYDISPLPRDEVPVQKDDDEEDELTVGNIPVNIIQDSPSPEEEQNVVEITGAMSRTESLYYTPDVTSDKLAELSLK